MINYLDLFAGAGGLSEGFTRSGYNPIAHVEMMSSACDTLRTRAVYNYLKKNNKSHIYLDYLTGKITKEEFYSNSPSHITDSIINKEISKKSIDGIFKKIDELKGDKQIDLILGGPPCQAYSIVGRARDKNNMKGDPRNFLYRYYVNFLNRYNPKVFIFENVPGILSASNGLHLKRIFNAIKRAGYNIYMPDSKILNSRDFNVIQDRKRVIIIGVKKGLDFDYPIFEKSKFILKSRDVLMHDLPKLNNGEGTLGITNYIKKPNEYLERFNIRNGIPFTTLHYSRPNNENDLEIYRIAVDSLLNKKKMLKYNELPKKLIRHKNISSFRNRFKVVNPDDVSHTVVAHIKMDGHYYIHPDIKQNRSISVREAARLQSFPDDFHFEGSRSAAFVQIGNAVPPLMSEGIATKIKYIFNG